MAKARRRAIFGAIEVRKQLELGKVKALIIAKNLSDDMLLDENFKFCIERYEHVPKIYAVTRKQLGTALLNQSSRIGIVGILKLDGVYDDWTNIIDQFKILKESWTMRYGKDPENIWECAYYGHCDLLKLILENCSGCQSFLNRGCFSTGKTPLIIAVERDHYETAKLLIEYGADQGIPDFALNLSIHLVKSENIAALLEYHDKKNASGLTAIETAIINQRLEVICNFIGKTTISSEKLFFAATVSNSDNAIRFLCDKLRSVDLNSLRNSNGNDLLMQAVDNGSYEVFKFLIGKKVQVNFETRNFQNENIFDISKRVGNVGISRYLEKHRNHSI